MACECSAVFASGQSDLEGAALCKSKGVISAECPVYGYDLNAHILDWVADGTIAGTVDQQPYLQGCERASSLLVIYGSLLVTQCAWD